MKTFKVVATPFIFAFTALLLVALVCALALHLGEDLNFDLLNYHYLNGYLYKHGLLFNDSIATIQSYIDPILNFVYYELISKTTPRNVALVLAASQSISLFGAFSLSWIFLRDFGKLHRFVISLVASTVPIILPIFWSEAGGTMGDVLLSSFVMASLIIATFGALITHSSKMKYLALFASGVSLGVVVGFKLTNAVFVIGLGVAISITLFMAEGVRASLKGLVFLGFGVAVGFAVCYGSLGLALWHAYGNPVFPYFSNIFKTPYMLSTSTLQDKRWFPTSSVGYLLTPFEYLIRRTQSPGGTHLIGMEIPFRVATFSVIYLLSPVYIYRTIKLRRSLGFRQLFSILLYVFFVTSFVVWEIVFSYYRYIAALEILSPLVLVVMVYSMWEKAPKSSVLPLSMAVIVCALGLYSLPDSNWGRAPFTSKYFGISSNEFSSYRSGLLVVGHTPEGFVVPFFPHNDQVIGLPERIPGVTQLFDKKYLAKLSRAGRNIWYVDQYSPSLGFVKAHAAFLLSAYHLKVEFSTCKSYPSMAYPIAVCRIEKA